MQKTILIIAGEASGDMYGAQLIKAFKSMSSDIRIQAVGGKLMRQAGAEIISDISEFAVIGFFEVLKNFKKYKYAFDRVVRIIDTTLPQAIVLIDFPGFNLRLAKKINKKIPVIYYISPQLWAWGRSRVNLIKRYVTKMIVIFKFEKDFYEKHGISVEYAGHPLLELISLECSRQELQEKYHLSQNKLTVGLMPGSRQNEIKQILPVLLESAGLIKKKLPDVQFILIKAQTVNQRLLNQFLHKYNINITIIELEHYAAINSCDLILVCSGTATVEIAMCQVPMIVVYKTAFFTWLILKLLIKTRFIGMVNIVAGKKIAEELIQHQANARIISRESLKLLSSKTEREVIRASLADLKQCFLPNNASIKTAEIILNCSA